VGPLCWRIGTYPLDKVPTPGPVIAAFAELLRQDPMRKGRVPAVITPHRLPGDAGPSQDTGPQPPGRLPPLADAGPLRRHLSARLLARP
jgi:hypothetical protein